MSKRVALFWPGDGREIPNRLARPNAEAATEQMMRSLRRLGREPYLIEGFIDKPHKAIEQLRPVTDPMIGLFVHWCYAPHTTDGVVGTETPLLLASNFSGEWPGLVGLLNTSASLHSLGRSHSKIWTDAGDWSTDDRFMAHLEVWLESGLIEHPDEGVLGPPEVSDRARALAEKIARGFLEKPALVLMLGDTSMGMINGYFGPRLLNRHGFAEHKIDQAWIIARGAGVDQRRIDGAFALVRDRGVTFHWGDDFTEEATREQLRDYLVVLDLIEEYRADCIGWQYQLGLIPLRPPSDLSEGLFNSVTRPEGNGDTIVCATEADQGNVLPMEMMKRLLKDKGLHQGVMFHDVRWGAEHDGRFLWVLLNSGSCGAYAFNHEPQSLKGVHSYRQPALYFPTPGGTFAGESLPGEITWARAFIDGDDLTMDVGRGEVVALPPDVRDAWWNGTTREWPFMAADLGIGRETLMAHYLSNHIAVAYGDIFEEMIALSQLLGFRTRVLADA